MRYRVSALLVAAAMALLGYGGLTAPQGGAVRLAYINSNVIIAQTPGASEAQATFEREMALWNSQVQALADSLQQMITAYEQQQIMLSPERRQERQAEIQQKRLEFEQRTADLEAVALRRRRELVEPIFERISNVLMQIQAEGQYTMIFDAASEALVAADTTLDITAMVIERLRAQQAGGGGGSAN